MRIISTDTSLKRFKGTNLPIYDCCFYDLFEKEIEFSYEKFTLETMTQEQLIEYNKVCLLIKDAVSSEK